MPQRTCTKDGCDKKHQARGLCSTHYNKQLKNRHPKVEVPCHCCGTPTLKEARQSRWGNPYCSYLCRDYTKFGSLSTRLPRSHPAIPPRTPSRRKPEIQRARWMAHTCEECGSTFITANHGQQVKFCAERCQTRTHKRRRRALEHNAQGTFTYTEVMRVYLKQGKVCAYCELPVVGLPDPEHVMPLSRGGRNDITNLVASCRPCNTDKGDLTLDEWAQDRERRGLPPVRTVLDGARFMHLVESKPSRPAWRDRSNAA